MRNKKASIVPSTLIWVISMFIVLFLIIIFLFVTTLLSSEGKLKFWKQDLTTEKGLDYSGVPISTASLVTLMNSEANYEGENIKIKELLKKWPKVFEGDKNEELKDKIQEELGTLLDNTGKSYVFHAELEIAQKERDRLSAEEAELLRRGYGLPAGTPKTNEVVKKAVLEFYDLKTQDCFANKDVILNKAPEIYLFSGQEKIKVELFVGQC